MELELSDGNWYAVTYSISYRENHFSTVVSGSETTRLTLCVK